MNRPSVRISHVDDRDPIFGAIFGDDGGKGLSGVLRVHEEVVAYFKTRDLNLESAAPGWPPNYTCGEFLKYAPFHVAYHTGQMYSVRRLLGEKTPDN